MYHKQRMYVCTLSEKLRRAVHILTLIETIFDILLHYESYFVLKMIIKSSTN